MFYHIKKTPFTLQEIVNNDSKGRYRFSKDGKRIKVYQGHSIPWVEPELQEMPPPEFLYYGTTTEAKDSIMASGAILRMARHAVHLTEDSQSAWRSACRRKGKHPRVLIASALALSQTGVSFVKSENDVWCCEKVPTVFIAEVIYQPIEPVKNESQSHLQYRNWFFRDKLSNDFVYVVFDNYKEILNQQPWRSY